MIQLTYLLYSRFFFYNVSCYSKLKILECVAFLQFPLQIFHLFQLWSLNRILVFMNYITVIRTLPSVWVVPIGHQSRHGKEEREVRYLIPGSLKSPGLTFLKRKITAVFNEVNYTWISFLLVFITSLLLSLGLAQMPVHCSSSVSALSLLLPPYITPM